MKRPIGIVRIRLVERGGAVWEYEGRNLFVNAGLPALAALLGGDTTGEFAAAVGFGTGSNAPTVSDTALTTPAYYKALDSHSEDGNGSVTFNWSLTTGGHRRGGTYYSGTGDLRESWEHGTAGNYGADADARAKDYCTNSIQLGNEY